jgi:hypothetical protein
MSKAAISVFAFGVYAIILGTICFTIPNWLLNLFGQPTTDEVWIRVMGMLIFHYGSYFILAARKELEIFFKWSVYPRSSVIVFFIIFVLADLVNPILLLFGIIDLLAGLWTFFTLRSSKMKS